MVFLRLLKFFLEIFEVKFLCEFIKVFKNLVHFMFYLTKLIKIFSMPKNAADIDFLHSVIDYFHDNLTCNHQVFGTL
jgi:hypothetical protein